MIDHAEKTLLPIRLETDDIGLYIYSIMPDGSRDTVFDIRVRGWGGLTGKGGGRGLDDDTAIEIQKMWANEMCSRWNTCTRPAVDVEALKCRHLNVTTGQPTDYGLGYNDAIDHLASAGYLAATVEVAGDNESTLLDEVQKLRQQFQGSNINYDSAMEFRKEPATPQADQVSIPQDVVEQLAEALKYARRFLKPEDADTEFIDHALTALNPYCKGN